jgi:hypothetical protein
MEVHHHADTPGKKWTHYFREFFRPSGVLSGASKKLEQ